MKWIAIVALCAAYVLFVGALIEIGRRRRARLRRRQGPVNVVNLSEARERLRKRNGDAA